MLRESLKAALAVELTKGLTGAIVKAAAKRNPNGRITLATLAKKVRALELNLDEMEAKAKQTLGYVEGTRENLVSLKADLEAASEISPEFIAEAVEDYVSKSI